jgi:hypothetical protein
MSTIYFDMDGTIANLYGVPNWLAYLESQDVTPYLTARPMFNFAIFARLLHMMQRRGHRIGIISALSPTGSEVFQAEIQEAKKAWLRAHLPSVSWDEIIFVPYGANKNESTPNPTNANKVLFDDEERNRVEWTGLALSQENLLAELRSIL